MNKVDTTYAQLDTPQLLTLKAAFERDRAAASDRDTVAFCEGRLAVIARILRQRGIVGYGL